MSYAEELEHKVRSSPLALLRAHDYCARAEWPADPQNILFALSSCKFQREFVSLFGIIREHELFSECMDHLVRRANDIRKEKPFDLVITCTTSARVLLEQIHDRIEGSDDLRIQYLGAHPYISPDLKTEEAVRGSHVLIVTDVIASGQLATQMAEMVYKLGGIPEAVLSLLVIGKEVAEKRIITARDTKQEGHDLRVEFLAPVLIEQIENLPEDYRIVTVHSETVMPEEIRNGENLTTPFFSAADFLRHVESAGAIDFGFYQTETRIITTAIRQNRLLRSDAGDLIWNECWQRVFDPERAAGGKTVLATTFSRDDLDFLRFVQEGLGKNAPGPVMEVAFAHQTEDPEDLHGHFMPQHDRGIVANATVILLLGSPVGSERVRKLVALLASEGAGKIRVLCLLNRMGRLTDTFIHRVRKLLKGRDINGGETDFQFFPVYSIGEADRVGLERMKQRVDEIFSLYHRASKVPSFQQWMEHEKKYFSPAEPTSAKFLAGTSSRLDEPYTPTWGKGVSATTLEGKLHLICGHLAGHGRGEASPLVELLEEPFLEKSMLYRLVGIVIANLSYMKLKRVFRTVRRALVERVCRSRALRLGLEAQHGSDKHIRDAIDEEIHALFALALLSYLDQDSSRLHEEHRDYKNLLASVVEWGMDFGTQTAHPVNLTAYFGEERVSWVISVLHLLSSYPSGAKDIGWSRRLELLQARFDKLLATTARLPGEEKTVRDERLRRLFRARSNIAMLRVELGEIKVNEVHELLRVLHGKIINVRRHHNPLISSLERARDKLAQVLDKAGKVPLAQGVSFEKDRATQDRLQDAVYTTGEMTQIATYVEALFNAETGYDRQEARRFIGPESLFSDDARRLAELILDLRRDKTVSHVQFEQLERLVSRVTHDLYEDASHLRQFLMRYRVLLQPMLLQCMEDGLDQFARERKKVSPKVWEPVIEQWRNSATSALVLCDPSLLRECLKNIFTNTRYTFEDVPLADMPVIYALVPPLTVEVLQTTAGDSHDSSNGSEPLWTIRVISRGKSFDSARYDERKDRSTFENHRRELRRYGATLAIQELQEPGWQGCEVRLTLKSRPPLRDE